MDLTREQTQTILNNAKEKGLSTQTVLDGLIKRGYNIEGIDTTQAKEAIARETPPAEEKPMDRGTETVEDIKQTGTEIVDSAKQRSANVGEAIEAYKKGDQGMLRTILQSAGQAAGLGSDVIGELFKGLVKVGVSQDTETLLKEGVTSVAKPIMESETVQNIVNKYKALDPKTQRDLDSLLGVGSLVFDVATAGVGGAGVKTGTQAIKTGAKKTAETIAETAIKGADTIIPALKKGADVVADVTKPIVEEAKLIPGRVATNIAAKKATEQAVKELPTKVAQTAARSGIEIPDIKYLYTIPKEFKATAKKLFQATKDFASGASKTNPLEIVGQPIVKSIKEAESFASKIGKKIGETANKLPSVTAEELAPSALGNLKKVRGLEDLAIDEKGVLDFTNTTLTTAGTEADRVAIQNIFNDAIKAGTGKQKHLLRQELFEILGGKKRSGVQLTGTQENAFEAIRKGLADVLDTKNVTYKKLNLDYAKALDPLKKLRKMLNVKGASGQVEEDILDMSAGLLARRLTSFAKSNPEIRNILNQLDKAVKSKGKTLLSTETMQDFYNILDKYYDIVGKTSLQGQVGAGLEKATGFKDFVAGKIRDVAGESKAVKDKLLEDMFNEILK
jgi:hypothetical protein